MESLQNNFNSRSVGQLAKSHLLTKKLNDNEGFKVGSLTKKTARTYTRRKLNKKVVLDKPVKQPQVIFKVRKGVENDFLQAVPLLFDHLEHKQVIFHNQLYVEAIFLNYHQQHAFLFLEWVKTFAVLRQENRATLSKGIMESLEDDFLRAFKLFKLQGIKPKQLPKNQQEKLWTIIVKYFPKQTFSTKELYVKTIIDKEVVMRLLHQFKAENKLKRCPKKGRCYCFQVVTH